MLHVWRGARQIFAECDICGSYGTAGHLQPIVRMTPEIAATVEQHTAHMVALRSHFKKAANEIARQVENGSMSRLDGSNKIRSMYANHVAQIQLATAALPSPDGKVTEHVNTCPWCGTKHDEVQVEPLPEDVAEPDFTLAFTAKGNRS